MRYSADGTERVGGRRRLLLYAHSAVSACCCSNSPVAMANAGGVSLFSIELCL